MTNWVDVASEDEFGKGQTRLVETDDTRIAVFNLDGEYFALEDICSHDGSPLLGCGLEPEDLVYGDELMCPRHGARFSIRNGEALTPPAYKPVRTFAVQIDNGMVRIRVQQDT